ncbi:trypsin-like serine protease [Rapidithrix thailandica]|uniref:Trypsin-like serine protease n=1 Tax=Rapidithrix thailandica TaxID=413964 RepID=A0AAW9RV13_9BACT
MTIVGGSEANIQDFPYQVALLDMNNGERLHCGGAILTKRFVLTAAHCLEGRDPGSLQVLIGQSKLSATEGQRFAIKRWVSQPFNPVTNEYDLAILELATPLDFTTQALTAQPIPVFSLAEEQLGLTNEGVWATISGWGAMQFGTGIASNQLRQAQVPVVANEKVAGWLDDEGITSKIFPHMLAAGKEEGGVDACQGDSGGPLVVNDAAGRKKLAGITSWGIGCGEARKPGIYTRVAHFEQWIYENAPVFPGLLISEVATPQATNGTVNYLEIANTGEETVNLDRVVLQIEDEEIPLSGEVLPGNVFLLANVSDATFFKDKLPDKIHPSLVFTGQERLAIRDTLTLRTIDQLGENALAYWHFKEKAIVRKSFVTSGNWGFFQENKFYEWTVEAQFNSPGVHITQAPEYDLEITNVEIPGALQEVEVTVCQDSVPLQLQVKNTGTQTVSSFIVNIKEKGVENSFWQVPVTFNAGVGLSPKALAEVDLSEHGFRFLANLGTEYTLEFSMSEVEGSADEVELNSHAEFQFTTSEQEGNSIRLSIQTDNFPEETSWAIKNEQGDVLFRGEAQGGSNGIWQAAYCLPSACYVLEVYDAFGDGIQGGSIHIENEDGFLLGKFDEKFRDQTQVTFCTQIHEVDAAIHLKEPDVVYQCKDSESISPVLEVWNVGKETIHQLQFLLSIGNEHYQETWSGTLPNGEKTQITLGAFNVAGWTGKTEKLKVKVNRVNAKEDTNLSNNTDSQLLDFSGNPVQLQIQSDEFASETFWELFSQQGVSLVQGGFYEDAPGSRLLNEGLCLPEGCFLLELTDVFDDGIDGGYFQVMDQWGNIKVDSGSFESRVQLPFCLPFAISQPANFQASVQAGHKVALSWEYTGPEIDGFQLFRSEKESGAFELLNTVNANTFSFEDGAASANTYFVYKIRAFKENLYSNYSNAEEVFTQPLGMQDEWNEKVKIYPNPTAGMVTVDLSGVHAMNLILYDLQGKVKPFKGLSGSLKEVIQLDLKGFPTGVYLLKVVTEEGVGVKRIAVLNKE